MKAKLFLAGLASIIIAVGWGREAFANACLSNGTGSWSDTTKWTSCGGVAPTSTDSVTIQNTHNITIDGTTHTVDSLTINTGGTLTQGNTSLQTVTNNMTIQTGGTLTHTANTTTLAYQINFSIGGNLDLTGTIDANGKGYGPHASAQNAGYGPGGGGGASATGGGDGGGGASAGDGKKGSDYAGSGGTAYLDATNPADAGSAGGNGQALSGNNGKGGNGGGLIILSVTGTTTINSGGLIRADGSTPTVNSDSAGGGGGGGGIKLTTGTLVGNAPASANITANGGAGAANASSYVEGGGGGGGAIAVYYTTLTSAATYEAKGGLGGANGDNTDVTFGGMGGAGIVYTKLASDSRGDFIVDHGKTASTTLSSARGDTDATILLTSSAAFPYSGVIQVDLELIEYATNSANSLTNVTRGAYGTTPAAHASGATVRQVALVTTAATTQTSGATYNAQNFTVKNGAKYVIGSGRTLDVTATSFGSATFDAELQNSAGTLALASTVTIPQYVKVTQTDGASFKVSGQSDASTMALTVEGIFSQGNYIASDTALALSSLTVNSGGVVNHSRNTTGTTPTHVLKLSVGTLTINTGGAVDVSSLGFQGGQTTRVDGSGPVGGYGYAATATAGFDGGGGAHGGDGRRGGNFLASGAGGTAYGDVTDPATVGSGGGSGYSVATGIGKGGNGGGLAIIAVSGSATVDGVIQADGSRGTSNSNYAGGGGGGGGVKLSVTGTLSGTGLISATGGNGGAYSTSNRFDGGGGGGGIVHVTYGTDSSTLSYNTAGGHGGVHITGVTDTYGGQGGAGILYKKATAASRGDFIVNNASPATTTVSGAHLSTATTITVASGGAASFPLRNALLMVANANGVELMHCAGLNTGTTFTNCTRGQFGTTAYALVDGDTVYNMSQLSTTATTTLASAMTEIATSLTVASNGANGFPYIYQLLQVDQELIYCTAVATRITFNSCIRGYNGTKISRHPVGATVYNAVSLNAATSTLGILTYLSGAHTDSATTITVDSTDFFPSSGTLLVESEQITYTGKTSTTFTGATRGANGTSAAAHADDARTGLLRTYTAESFSARNGANCSLAPGLTLSINTGAWGASTTPGQCMASSGSTLTLPSSTTIPSNVTMIVQNGATVTSSASKSLTVSGAFQQDGYFPSSTALSLDTLTVNSGGVVKHSLPPTANISTTHTNAVTTITVYSTDGFPTAGTLLLETEQITYTGKTSTTFTGCTRGANSTTAAAHNTVPTLVYSMDATNSIKLSLATLTVNTGGAVDVSSLGYQGGQTTRVDGVGPSGGYGYAAAATAGFDGGGGAHGGDGRRGGDFSASGAGGTAYGDVTDPATTGAGGGSGYSVASGLGKGGNGGGLAIIAVSVDATINGAIQADGARGSSNSGYSGGGGAGGGVKLSVTGNLYGTGLISATGGNGGYYSSSNRFDGGGGGGGVIYVTYGADLSTLSYNTAGGYGGVNLTGVTANYGGQGGAGILYKKATAASRGDFIVNNASPATTTVSGAHLSTDTTITVASGGTASFPMRDAILMVSNSATTLEMIHCMGLNTGTTFTNCTRGQWGTTAYALVDGDVVYNMSQLSAAAVTAVYNMNIDESFTQALVTPAGTSSFPPYNQVLLIDQELFYCTSLATGTAFAACSRGYNGTTVTPHAIGTPVYNAVALNSAYTTQKNATTYNANTFTVKNGANYVIGSGETLDVSSGTLGASTTPAQFTALSGSVLTLPSATTIPANVTMTVQDGSTFKVSGQTDASTMALTVAGVFAQDSYVASDTALSLSTLTVNSGGVVTHPIPPIANISTTHTSAVTTITVYSTDIFPSSGTLLIETEQITYTGKTATTFTGCTRGANGTTAAAHNTVPTPVYSMNVTHSINLSVATLTINTGGAVDVSSLGFQGGQTTRVNGVGPSGGYGYAAAATAGFDGGGGAHGGDGRGGGDFSASGAGGTAYGDVMYPATIGAGGGSGYSIASGLGKGGNGGGLAIIAVSGNATINGAIQADGGSGSSTSSNYAGGGGAGGGVKLSVTGTLSGAGLISATGGNGGGYPTSKRFDGGGGGGGIVYVTYGTDSSTLSYNTAGGNGGVNVTGVTATYGGQGGAGILYKKATAASLGDFIVNNASPAITTTISGAHTGTVNTITVASGGTASFPLRNAILMVVGTSGLELMHCAGINSGTTFTNCARAKYGTTAYALANGDTVYNMSQFSTTATTTLGVDLTQTATSMTVASNGANGFLYDYQLLLIEQELIYCTAVSTRTTFNTCNRGYNGTTPVAHSTGAVVYSYVMGNAANTPQKDGSSQSLDNFTVKNGANYVIGSGETLAVSAATFGSTTSPASLKNASGGTLTLPSTFTIPANVTLIQTDGGALTGSGSMTLTVTGTLQQDSYVVSDTPLAFFNVTVGGKITHTENTSALAHMVTLNVANDMTIDSSGSVFVKERGYTGGRTTRVAGNGTGGGGAASVVSSADGGGGGHGGGGGAGMDSGGAAGSTYDSSSNPANLGSGGGSAYSVLDTTTNGGIGGDGGGLIYLDIGRTLTVTGTINANGADQPPCNSDNCGGGGAGGGIRIVTDTLAGSGTISANGGPGAGTNEGGGSGGGLIYIKYRSSSLAPGNVTVTAGAGAGAEAAGTATLSQGSGLSATNVEPASLVINTSNVVTVSFTTTTAIASTGKIKTTFGSGFNVASASGATCVSMDGSFATAVQGQTVIITRSAGTSETAGVESCTFSNITNPSSAGSTGTYAIKTTDSNDLLVDSDPAVAADTIISGASRRILHTSFNDIDPLWQEARACVDPESAWKLVPRSLECSM